MNSLYLLSSNPEAAAGEGAATGGSLLTTIIPFALVIGIFYFLIIRPQNKKQKDTQRMLSAIKKGDKIVTIGGIHGTIYTVRDDSVIVKVDDGTKIEFSRSAVSSIVAEGKAAVEEKSAEGKAGGLKLFGSKKKDEAVDAVVVEEPEAAAGPSEEEK
ncbi:MAG: preprotein translocase subunit YajC [Treponema sp.]|jgi:preprotein translocase subunit YajC|nr:preprotein translocase subunit YajC [Treponema sp.]